MPSKSKYRASRKIQRKAGHLADGDDTSECMRRSNGRQTELFTTMSSQSSSGADSPSGPRRRKMWLIEGDTPLTPDILRSSHQKKNQHHKLMDALTPRGLYAKLMIFAFMVGGTIYRQTMEDMRQLGVSTANITKTLKDIHLHSVTYATNIITQRRLLDRQKLKQPHHTQQYPP